MSDRLQPGPEPQAPIDVVVPTTGRASLRVLLDALGSQSGPPPESLVLVDDRRAPSASLPVPPLPAALAGRLRIVRGPGRGPAAARNAGWRAGAAEWVAFLDDDVVPEPGWLEVLHADLARAGTDVAGSQGRIRVPLPQDRRPTDWERNVAGLEHARWATADLAYRRRDLRAAGGFDERFPRAYREDADLGLRLTRAGRRIARGERRVLHPVRPAGPWVSVAKQAGNGDDVLMRALHGSGWRRDAGAPPGRRPRHVAVTAAAAGTVAAAASGRPVAGAMLGAAWLTGTLELAAARIAPGPRTPGEVATMALTSAVLPAAATVHALSGVVRHRRALGRAALGRLRPGATAPGSRAVARAAPGRPDAVLLDRDGTLVVDVPYNGDPARVEPMPGARAALDRLRGAGIPLAVVSNQSGVGRGLVTREQVDAVNRRAEELLGPIEVWAVCPHAPGEGCGCRKPAPGLVRRAADALGVDPERCALVGDIGADVGAARAAGARAVLVPTPVTLGEEVDAAPELALTLGAAVDRLLEDPA